MDFDKKEVSNQNVRIHRVDERRIGNRTRDSTETKKKYIRNLEDELGIIERITIGTK